MASADFAMGLAEELIAAPRQGVGPAGSGDVPGMAASPSIVTAASTSPDARVAVPMIRRIAGRLENRRAARR
ncbi:hypothetical protein ACLBWX_08485 [Methylobacterium sp. M6A4_1b]